MQNFFHWYFSLFSDSDNNVRLEAWSATIATLGFLGIIIKPFRNFKRFQVNMGGSKTFGNIEIKYSKEELRSKLKIIVVDDDDIFPIDGFQKFGYNIDKISKLNEQKLKMLRDGTYGIIILDIYGVAKEIADNDGLDVILDIKSHNPSQVIVAYSGQSFDLSKNKFWEMADEKLSKPTSFIATQNIIDHLIAKTFTVDYHMQKIKYVLNENNLISQFAKIEKIFVQFKQKNKEPNWFSELSFLTLKSVEREKLVAILSKLYFYSTLKRK